MSTTVARHDTSVPLTIDNYQKIFWRNFRTDTIIPNQWEVIQGQANKTDNDIENDDHDLDRRTYLDFFLYVQYISTDIESDIHSFHFLCGQECFRSSIFSFF